MKKYTNFKGGRRSFHVILFILLVIASAILTNLFSSTSNKQTTNSNPQPTVEYRSPEELHTLKIYNVLTKVNAIDDSLSRWTLSDAVRMYGTQYSIDPFLLLSIAKCESEYTKKIVSRSNCAGYFQINLNVHKVSPNFMNDTYEQTKKACEVLMYCKSIYPNKINYINSYNGNASSNNPYAFKVLKIYDEYLLLDKEINI